MRFQGNRVGLAIFTFAVLLLYYTFSSLRVPTSTSQVPPPGRIKHVGNPQREQAMKDVFRHAWKGYQRYAMPSDALKPLSKTGSVTRSNWGATVVDGLPTAIMMDMPDIVDTMMQHVASINFTETDASVSLFGVTIRYLGGLMSAYDLLTTTHPQMDKDGSRAQMLLRQATSLAKSLSFAYETDSGIPQNNLRLSPKPVRKRTPVNDIVAAGVPAFEFFHLSALTNDEPISKPALSALEHILAESSDHTTPFPGLSGRYLDISTGEFVDAEGGWYGGAGGLYEYLLKLYITSPIKFPHLLERWKLVANSTIQHLASSPASRPDLTFLASYNGTEILYNSDHTAHFAAATFLLAGSVLNSETYTSFGLKLVDTQIEMYRDTATGLGPDKFAWLPHYCHNLHGYKDIDPLNSRYPPNSCKIPASYASQSTFAQQNGYYITSPLYLLRPEVLESLYYAYRLTGSPRYQTASWEIFTAILEHCRVESSGGLAGLQDIMTPPDKQEAVRSRGKAGGMDDMQYSYVLAETFKYAWLVQSEKGPWHVGGNGGWVFSTEGHPLRVRG